MRLPPELRSVSRARARLVEVASAWGCPSSLVDDARVVLSELMSNGVLHARTELDVHISLRGERLHVEVHDSSPAPVVPRFGLPQVLGDLHGPPRDTVRSLFASPAATGRGLAMVQALADAWGWSPEAGGGKMVWAELGAPGEPERGGAGNLSGLPAYALQPVRLIAVPLRLLKESEDHLDGLFREVQMVGHGSRAEAHGMVGELARAAEEVREALVHVREPARRAVWEAVHRGDRLLDVDLLVDADLPNMFQQASELLAKAARAASAGLLLTEPPGHEVAAWRRWLCREVEAQMAGHPPRACPFPVAPVGEEEPHAP
jgi:anti-sigma regulatory factor (Ser/Thr protein kinase)